jgi:hypothetical protein
MTTHRDANIASNVTRFADAFTFSPEDGWIIHPYKSFPATLNIVSLEGGASGGGRLEIVEESFVRCRNSSTSIFLQLAI